MTRRKIIVAESQIDRLLGEGFMSYLENKEDANEAPPNEYGTEAFTDGKDANGDDMKSPCTDRVARERYPRNPFSYWNGTRGFALGGRVMTEDNQDLMGRQFSVNAPLKKEIQANAKDSGDKLLNNMADEKSFNIKTAYKRRHDLNKMKAENPEEFKATGRDRILRDISNQIENAKGLSKSNKETKKNAGIDNAFQKPGGTKNSGNGKAHTTKNPITIIPNK